ncbi:MAG: UDP-N-acetylmuramoyl-L-alanine--D-glutamate ligase [Eubacterium sp.]|jgi:UDP-N-acetylmuramoylalanine--D-glutamate ligase|nr:UDP-N-acetylmuramoyl-L-alanine--D-glutamate ligase [Eubacterium sp.]MCH4047527.1 UDP-N-acetylmuramoyl-L-alanine--D-glutamate ligase [Eubacterium sp.]MCH4078297.1 UDP-N-acetylmuramoyl-L-alanine--D-glutamate ligase [Eubacterium sp.]MCH4109444.1 UDP-N-acetylmuramoyl-L-alanine--D-glutamate ligase [Eubacterium sp.]MCI1307598.1 UDP-N-acetylmuramoyl-L-alanine--D-glutamate ligase [Eubacterium sp.]
MLNEELSNKANIARKNVLIVGLGKSGIAAAQAMLHLNARVSIQDSKKREEIDTGLLSMFEDQGVKFYLGETPEDMTQFEMLILSPGVSPELPFIQAAMDAGVEVTGELEIAYRIGKGRYVAITGTNGKTTTTTLTGEIFKRAGRSTYVVGNIGNAVIAASEKSTEDDWMVTEASSFQLETTRYFKPVVSAILNISPDHMNRHHTMGAYIAAKSKIFANQTENDYFISNMDDPICRKLMEQSRAKVVPFSSTQQLEFGAFVQNGRLVLKKEDGTIVDFLGADEMKIIGDHNIQNALAAAAISYCAGIDEKTIGDAIRAFGGVEHRLEYCGNIQGVDYYNDSKGTNTDAAEIAIKAVGKNIILIAGGDAKGQNFDAFVQYFKGRVKHVLLLGRDAHFIRESAEKIGFNAFTECKDMDDCVKKGFEMAQPGDTVLLSPACASWDMYDNYEQRGEHFKDCVRRLES